jgi:hypothetical protein
MSEPDPHQLQPGHAPTPFVADEIRAGCPVGRTIRLLVDGEGESYVCVQRFAACDESGATIESWREGDDGRVAGQKASRRSTWLELQGHASFPAANTQIAPDELELPIGRLRCLRYTVRAGPIEDSNPKDPLVG